MLQHSGRVVTCMIGHDWDALNVLYHMHYNYIWTFALVVFTVGHLLQPALLHLAPVSPRLIHVRGSSISGWSTASKVSVGLIVPIQRRTTFPAIPSSLYPVSSRHFLKCGT